MSQRFSDVQERLVQEFADVMPPETVERCLRESLQAYQDARISDFVPLFVHRETRERLVRIASRGSNAA
jgi:hypothetical protein